MRCSLKTLWFILIASLVLVSCNEQKKELQEQVDKLNSECPLPLGDIGSINSIMFDGEVVEMKFTSNESFAPISSLSNHQKEMKEALCMSLTMDSSKKLVDKIVAVGAEFRVVFVGLKTSERAEFTITTDELTSAVDMFSNLSEQQKLVITMYIGTKVKLPVVIDDMTKLVGLTLTSDALKYKFEVNDAETGEYIDATGILKYSALTNMANSMKGGIMGERNRQFYQALIDCNQGTEYEYYELHTGKRASFRISTDEIREVLNGKWDNQLTAQQWEQLVDGLEELFEDSAMIEEPIVEEVIVYDDEEDM